MTTARNRTCQSRTRSRVGWGCLGLIVLSLMILACGLGLYKGVTLRDDLVSHAVPIPVAADRSTATATRHEPEHSHLLIARLLANGYDY